MVLSFFEWMSNLAFSRELGASAWAFALIQALHLVALAVFAGAVLIVDLRLMGRALIERPLRQVARDANPWLLWGFVALTVTGIPQLMQNAMREYYSPLFWIKMVFLALALIFTVTLRRKATHQDQIGTASGWTKAVGVISVLLWAGVAIPARLIGLFS